VRVAVADDSLLTRAGIVSLLREAGIDVVGEVGDADDLLRLVRHEQPDAVVVDIRMPPTHTDEGLVAAARIRAGSPDIAVLVLSQYVEASYALRLLAEHPNGVGYLLKDRVMHGAALVDSLQRLVEGETIVDPTIVHRLLSRRRAPDPLERLTAREREVLALVSEGLSNHAIGDRLRIADRTVEAHITQTFEKLGLEDHGDTHRRVLAALTYLRVPGPGRNGPGDSVAP
jgi:DNA-binding NarL/FixJ family response regulator